MVAVILIHSLPASWAKLTAGSAESVLFLIASTWTRWCVPVFFMLSGALLLDERRNEPARQFYARRAMRVGVPTLVWSVIYLVYFQWGRSEPISVSGVVIALVTGRPAGHLWFVFALTGLYLATPAIRKLFFACSPGEQFRIASGALALASAAVVCWTIVGRIRWETPPDPVFVIEWLPYLGYFLMGRVLRSYILTGYGTALAIGILLSIWGVGSSGLGMLTLSNQQIRGEGMFVNYLSPFNVVQSTIVFLLMATWLRGRWAEGPLLKALGDATFGAYLVHLLVLEVLEGYWSEFGQTVPMVVITWAVAVVVSFAFGWGAQRVPILRRCVGV